MLHPRPFPSAARRTAEAPYAAEVPYPADASRQGRLGRAARHVCQPGHRSVLLGSFPDIRLNSGRATPDARLDWRGRIFVLDSLACLGIGFPHDRSPHDQSPIVLAIYLLVYSLSICYILTHSLSVYHILVYYLVCLLSHWSVGSFGNDDIFGPTISVECCSFRCWTRRTCAL